jgi:hypothetical protein
MIAIYFPNRGEEEKERITLIALTLRRQDSAKKKMLLTFTKIRNKYFK